MKKNQVPNFNLVIIALNSNTFLFLEDIQIQNSVFIKKNNSFYVQYTLHEKKRTMCHTYCVLT